MKLKLYSLRLLLLAFCCMSLAGCSFIDKMKSDNKQKPARLVKFKEEVKMRRLWKVNVGSGQGDEYNRLQPVIEDGVIYAAGNNGIVVAANDQSGKLLWRKKTKFDITGGVGVDSDRVLFGTVDAQVVAVSKDTGADLWKTTVTSEVLSAPVSNDSFVVVQTVDGNLIGLDAETGKQKWIYENTVPVLSVRGTSTPRIFDDFVIASLANGTVVSLAIDNGTCVGKSAWQYPRVVPTSTGSWTSTGMC